LNAFDFPHVPRPGDDIDWDTLVSSCSWFASLSATPQDPVYHAEGDVGTHTRLVVEALIKMEDWQRLSQVDRGILFWAALLHDIAKPVCTQIDPDGRVRTPRHTIKGECMARQILYKGLPSPFPFELREKIVKLVRYHGLPLWLMDKDDPLKRIIRASRVADLKLLAQLAEADVRGRHCDDSGQLLEQIRFFAEYASETGCFGRPYPFETDLARITYLNSDNGSPKYVPYDTTWGKTILMLNLRMKI